MVDELLAAPRRLAQAIWRIPDRLLYGSRRRAVQQVFASRPRPRRILVVCHGNICRSPFAAHLLAQLVGPLGVTVESAGFVGPGRSAPAEGIEAARRFGVDLTAHRSGLITPRRALAADAIVVMDGRQAVAMRGMITTGAPVIVLGDCDPQFPETRAIADPVAQPTEAFVESYTRIERCVHQLAALLRRGSNARNR